MKIKKYLPELKRYSILLIQILFIVWMYRTFGKYGILGLILAVIIVVLVRGWKSRHQFIDHLRSLESVMWGKPLDKKYWKKDELKNTKLKPKWGGKKNGKTKTSKDFG